MDNLLISVASIIVGVVATIWVSHYYYRRSTRKALTPFIQFFTSVFRGVDPSVKDSLKIAYKGALITDLFEVQFLIAITGVRAIRDLIKPLTLKISTDTTILDASILHIHPDGRDVSIEMEEQNVVFIFPLLNPREFFIAKPLLHGNPSPRDFKFAVSGDDLPPHLYPKLLPPNLIETDQKRGFEIGLFIAGLVVTIIGASFASLIYAQSPIIAQMWGVGFVDTLRANWIISISCIIAAVPTLLLLVIGPMVILGAFADFSVPGRTRFPIPSDYVRHPFPLHRIEMEYLEARKADALNSLGPADEK